MTTQKIAKRLVTQGYPVIPVIYKQKKPAISGWTHFCEELPSPSQVSRWFKNAPRQNLGIACGSRVVAFDIDYDCFITSRALDYIITREANGMCLRRVGRPDRRLLVYGVHGKSLPSTKVGQIDILGEGKQFVALGLHPEGMVYDWIEGDGTKHGHSPEDVALAELTPINRKTYDKILEALKNATQAGGLVEKLLTLPPRLKKRLPVSALKGGEIKADRSHHMHVTLRGLLEHGFTRQEIITLARAFPSGFAEKVFQGRKPEKIERELQKRIDDAVEANGGFNQPAEVIYLDSVKSRKPEWLMKNFIPKNELVFVDGDPGAGKTYLLLALMKLFCDGDPLPDGTNTRPLKILYLSRENDIETVIKPRLEAIGLKRPEEFGVYAGTLSLNPQGLKQLQDMVIKHGPDILVIDPVMDYIAGETDINAANKVSSVLTQLVSLQRTQKLTIIMVRHLTKGGKEKALYRGLGSIQFVGAARAVIHVGNHPHGNKKGYRVAACAKNSNGPIGASILFEIAAKGDFAEVVFKGTDTITAEELNTLGHHETGGVKDQIKTRLQELCDENDGVVSSDKIALLEEEGFTRYGIQTSLKALGAKAKPCGQRGKWLWHFPLNNSET